MPVHHMSVISLYLNAISRSILFHLFVMFHHLLLVYCWRKIPLKDGVDIGLHFKLTCVGIYMSRIKVRGVESVESDLI